MADEEVDQLAIALAEVTKEYEAASKFPLFNSAHEGYAVLAEEVDELWDEVKKNQKIRSEEKLRAEAKQVAAMALKLMVSLAMKPYKAGTT